MFFFSLFIRKLMRVKDINHEWAVVSNIFCFDDFHSSENFYNLVGSMGEREKERKFNIKSESMDICLNCTISLHSIKVSKRHSQQMIFQRKISEKKTFYHFFLLFFATISIQIHPDTAKMCFTKIEMDLLLHLIKLICPKREKTPKKEADNKNV